ncbi:MAG: nucleotidyltransferase domain-containing protein [Nanopusillaceae archaeon]
MTKFKYINENTYFYYNDEKENKRYIICTVGDVHEKKDNITYLHAIPTYVEDPEGNRISKYDGKKYSKINLYEVKTFLSNYLVYSKSFGLTIHKIPLAKTEKEFSPWKFAKKIYKKNFENDYHIIVFKEFIDEMRRYIHLPINKVGVEGSVLLGLHLKSSDLDILIRGKKIIDVEEVFKILKSENKISNITLKKLIQRRKIYHFVPNKIHKIVHENFELKGIYKNIKIGIMGVREYRDIKLERDLLKNSVKKNLGVISFIGHVMEESYNDLLFHPLIFKFKVEKIVEYERSIEKEELKNIKSGEEIIIMSYLPNYYRYALPGYKTFIRGRLQLMNNGSYRLLLHFYDTYIINKFTIYPILKI